jgi:uncharacterized protein (TIGR03437 family)
LYFTTVFRQKGTEQSANPKVVRWERGRGFELFAERERIYPFLGGNVSNYYRLTRPQVSADGRVVKYETTRDCVGGSSCVFVPRVQTEYVGGVVRTVQGNVWLSPDGKHAVERRDELPGQPSTFYFRDLVAGTERGMGGVGQGPFTFTARGELLVRQSNRWRLLDERSVVREYPELDGVTGCRIALNGTGPYCGEALIGLTDAGWKLLLQDGELSLHSGWSPRRIAIGVTSATISGYGNVIYYSTTDNRLVRFNTADETTEELAGPTPVIGVWRGGVAPGALNFVEGTDTHSVRLNGKEVEVAGEGRFLVPVDVPLGPATLTGFSATSPFEFVPQVREAKASDPEFLQFGVQVPGAYGPVIINEDFTAVVDHAAPGSIVHFYLTGLGGAKPACTVRFLQEAPRAADTLYIGPAPGIPGVDQFSMRVPLDVPQFFVLSCGDDARSQVFVPSR